MPALLVSLVTGLGPNGVLDTVKTNCQKFLEAKWSHLFHAARALQNRSIHTNRQLDCNFSQQNDPERLFRHARQLIQSGSLSAAYQCLTEPGLSQDDPYDHFVQIHRNDDISDLNLHNNIMQEVRDSVDWKKNSPTTLCFVLYPSARMEKLLIVMVCVMNFLKFYRMTIPSCLSLSSAS